MVAKAPCSKPCRHPCAGASDGAAHIDECLGLQRGAALVPLPACESAEADESDEGDDEPDP